jgi:hypothetical protein
MALNNSSYVGEIPGFITKKSLDYIAANHLAFKVFN